MIRIGLKSVRNMCRIRNDKEVARLPKRISTKAKQFTLHEPQYIYANEIFVGELSEFKKNSVNGCYMAIALWEKSQVV